MNHVIKHLIHGVFLLVMAVAVRTSGLDLSAFAVVAVVVVSLLLLEGGLWLINRREQAAKPAS